MNKVSDDKKPMTGTWYRSTIERWMLGKVTKIDGNVVTMATSDGDGYVGTIQDFAKKWELS